MIKNYFANPRLVILILIAIITIGVTSYITLPRTLNPQIKIPIVLVSTVLPGANPSDVEQLVTIPLEDAIQNVEKIKTMTSSSRDSVSIITVEFESGVDPEKARTDVSSRVDSVTNLPDDTQTPAVIKLDFANQPVWTFALTGLQDEGSLFKFAKSLQTKLKDLPEIDKVALSGLEEREIEVTIKPQVYATYQINPITISNIVQTGLRSFPAGTVKTGTSSFALSIDPQIVDIADIRLLRLNLQGSIVALSDIADISEHPKPDQGQSYLAKKEDPAKRAVTVNVFKTSGANIDKAVAAAEGLVNGELLREQNKFTATTLINTATLIDDQYRELTRDFLITITLVVLVLFIFLGARAAIVSTLSAPLSFLITFAMMKGTGLTLNFLSLFSLLLSLGLLVDDTVVVISAMTSYFRSGKWRPLQTGVLVFQDFLIPVLATTITTVWAFLPLLLSTGIIGEFIKSIPIVVSTALIGSFFVGMFITLPLIILLLEGKIPRRVTIVLRILFFVGFVSAFLFAVPKAGGALTASLFIVFFLFLFVALLVREELWGRARNLIRHSGKRGTSAPRIRSSRLLWIDSGQARMTIIKRVFDNGLISFVPINKSYKSIMETILSSSYNRKRAIAMVVIFSLFSFVLLPIGFVKNEFFPKEDSDYIYINLELPSGTSFTQTREEALHVLDQLRKAEQLDVVTADAGQSFSSQEGGPGGAGGNNVLFTLILTRHTKRHITSGEIAQHIRDTFATYTKGDFQVQEVSGGPPAGADLQIKLLGDDLRILDQYADKVDGYLETQQGVANINKSIKPGTSKLVFIPDTAALSQHHISLDQVGLLLRTYASGFIADKYKFPGDTEDTDITLRLYSTSVFADTIGTLTVPAQSGNVPLTELGKIILTPNPTLITREDGKRTISVAAAVSRGFNIAQINKGLETFADRELGLPQGYTWKTGGVNEENNQSVQSILQAMLLSFLLIVTTMVVQFGSFRRAIMVMLVIPLSISGVFIMFALTGTPLSFPALIGVLALFGIVVKNAILVVDKIVKNEKAGMKFVEAIADASASRLEPIALTSFCTIIGLVPITLSDPLWRGLGGAIIAGLTFSGTIMLFFIPVVYYYFFAGATDRKK